MSLTISDKKYDELKKLFDMMSPKQTFIVAAFALERLWEPFAEGIFDCAYTEQERQEVQRLENEISDIIWTHILFEDTQIERWKDFCELYDQIEDLSAEVDLNFKVKPYYCAIVDFASWCLKGNHAERTNRVRPDIVVGPLDLIVDCVSAKTIQHSGDRAQDILERHPAVLAEIKRIDADIQMAKEFPNNINSILQRKAEYHSLNISHI